MKTPLFLTLLVILLSGSAANAQRNPLNELSGPKKTNQTKPAEPEQKPDENDSVVRVSTTLVQMDAVVLDGKGRIVTDLKPSDFTILQNNKPQEITNFTFITAQPGALGTVPAGPPTATTNTARLPVPRGPVPPPVLRPEEIHRTIALVVDDLGLSKDSLHHVREGLKTYIAKNLQPGDVMAILRTSSGSGLFQQFTTDPKLLMANIEQLQWKPYNRLSSFESLQPGAAGPTQLNRNPKGALGNQEELPRAGGGNPEVATSNEFGRLNFTVGALGSLNYIVRALQEMPGRKSVVLFSEGFSLFNRERDNFQFVDGLRKLVEQANRASVVFYTIDPRGGDPFFATAADDLSGPPLGGSLGSINKSSNASPGREAANLSANRKTEFLETQEGLSFLAKETGGFLIRNNNDMSDALKKVANDQAGYYLIGFVPEEDTFQPEKQGYKFHKLKVKVNKPGLTVRSRTGFYGLTDAGYANHDRTGSDQIQSALISPFAISNLPVRLTGLFGNDGKNGSFIQSLLYIDARSLQFETTLDNWKQAVFDVLAVTFGENGKIADQVSKTFTLRLTPEMHQQALERGLVQFINFPLKKAGVYQFRIALRDSGNGRIGTAYQLIQAPNVEKGQFGLSGLVVFGNQPQTPQPVSQSAEKLFDGLDPQTSPAVRKFRAGSRLNYDFIVYNPKLSPTEKTPQLESQVRVFQGGEPVFSGQVRSIAAPAGPDFKRIRQSGQLSLSRTFQPGQYVLEVLVWDKNARNQAPVSQWIEFDVLP